ncbi:error-prone DNA polymerase, partial [Pseudomonas aeruginosa]|nr:error-prone DNA polymerase [Pseudomonas aeruginosa]
MAAWLVRMSAYAELHCLSNFSFQRGASSAAELFARAARLGYRALAITDECSLAGIVRAWQAAREHQVQLIIGSEIRLEQGPKLVLLAEDLEGYQNLCRLITRGRRQADKGHYRLLREDLQQPLAGLLAIWLPNDHGDEQAAWLRERFPQRLWLGVELHRGADDDARLDKLLALASHLRLPPVACGDVHMHARGRRALQDCMTAIRSHLPVSEAGAYLFPNGERHLRTLEALQGIYPQALLAETLKIAERCRFDLEQLKYQ